MDKYNTQFGILSGKQLAAAIEIKRWFNEFITDGADSYVDKRNSETGIVERKWSFLEARELFKDPNGFYQLQLRKEMALAHNLRAAAGGGSSRTAFFGSNKEVQQSLKNFYHKNIGRVYDEAQFNDNESDFSASFYGPVYSDRGKDFDHLEEPRIESCTNYHKRTYKINLEQNGFENSRQNRP